MKILIAGAGIGGMALAALLRQRGITAESSTNARPTLITPLHARGYILMAHGRCMD